MIDIGGAGLQDAIKMMTTSPAAAMNLSDRGRIAPGRRADLTFWDEDMRIVGTMIGGRWLEK
jgi:N-acetylglucosamine-6-phosphate deacetylase